MHRGAVRRGMDLAGSRRSRGQGLVEFALVFPIFMLILGGVIQFGIIFWGQNTLNQVARDTGRWAASQQSCTDAAGVRATADQIARASSLIGYAPGTWTSSGTGDVTVAWSCTTPPKRNTETAWITVSLHHQVPVFFPWLPGNGAISTTTEFRMEPEAK